MNRKRKIDVNLLFIEPFHTEAAFLGCLLDDFIAIGTLLLVLLHS